MELFEELAVGGAPLVVKTLAGLDDGSIEPQPQNHEGATFAPMLDREDGRMDFAARTAHELKNRWRGFQPWPGAFTTLGGKKLIVHRHGVVDASVADGCRLLPNPAGFTSKTIGFLSLALGRPGWSWLKFSWKARNASPPAEFLRGNALAEGARLGTATE